MQISVRIIFFEASEEQAVELVSVESWDTQKQLLEEKEALGFYFSGHPFTYYKKMIREFIPTKLSELTPRESPYLVAGIISDVRFKMTSRGKIAIITLDDSEGREWIWLWEARHLMTFMSLSKKINCYLLKEGSVMMTLRVVIELM